MQMEKKYPLKSHSKKENKSESENENPNLIDYSQPDRNRIGILFRPEPE